MKNLILIIATVLMVVITSCTPEPPKKKVVQINLDSTAYKAGKLFEGLKQEFKKGRDTIKNQ
jgi:hypothetical protein